MSVNVSLVESDTPGVSLYFDGQNVGDLQEAELQREEERQAKELQRLLETELEDFEDDFLSGSNSEDEDMASFDVRDSATMRYEPGPRVKLAVQPSLSPTTRTLVKLQSIAAGLSKSEPGAQPSGQAHGGTEHNQIRHDGSLTHAGTKSGQYDTQPSPLVTVDMPGRSSHFQHLISANQNQDHRHYNYLNIKATNPHAAENHHNHVLEGHGHQTDTAAEDCNVTDLFLSLPSSNQKQNNVLAAENQPWADNFTDGRYQFSSLPENMTANVANHTSQTESNEISRPDFHFVSSPSGHNLANMRVTSGSNMDDGWMMQIKRPALTSYQHPDHTSHQHPHFPYQQQWQSADNSNGFLHNTQPSAKNSASPHADSTTVTYAGPPAASVEASRNSTLQLQSIRSGISSHPQSNVPPSSSIHPSRPALAAFSSRDDQSMHHTLRSLESSQIPDSGDGQFGQYKVHYQKPGPEKVGEEEFYLGNEHVDFFRKGGSEDQRTYEQLEILYRARGREIEDLTQKMTEKDEEKSKEIRSLKHKLAIANGEAETMDESLQQSQKLLQQATLENTEAAGKVRALEAQVASLREAKEELIKKLQAAESTIENVTHHIEELQNSESLSRARNGHEAIVSSLTNRYEKELLAVKEKLDDSKTDLEVKQEEVIHLRKQLMDTTRELEQAQISRGETINRLARSLEDSQRQCQTLLEKSSSHELSVLKVQLQQAVASKRISEDLCTTFQIEVRELKEQLNMFEQASNLGVFTQSSHAPSGPCHDDSMTDLGIRKTLNFDSPQYVARYDGTQTSDDLIASLRSELEKCLYSNKQKRSEVAEKVEEVKALREGLEEARNKIDTLETTCLEQKNRLQTMDSLNNSGDGVRVGEARLRRDIEDLKHEQEILLSDIEDYKKRLQEVGDSEAKLAEINSELSHQIAQMVNDFDVDKRASLESCQRMMEEVSRISIEKLRQETEERFQSEKTMLTGSYTDKIHHLKQELMSAQAELDSVKSIYIKTCEESAAQESELTGKFRKQLEEELGKVRDKLETDKRDWESFMRAEMDKERFELRRVVESELLAESERGTQAMISQAKQACLEEQMAIRQTMVDKALVDASSQWQLEHERDLQAWSEERSSYETKLARLDEEICNLKQKLTMGSVGEMGRSEKSCEVMQLEFVDRLKATEKQHKEEIDFLRGKYDRERVAVEEKLDDMSKQFSGRDLSSTGSRSEISESSCGLLRKLEALEKVWLGKGIRLEELEKMLGEASASAGTCGNPETKLVVKERDMMNLMERAVASEDSICFIDSLVQRRGTATDTGTVTLVESTRGCSLDDIVASESLLVVGSGRIYGDEFDDNPGKMKEYIKKLESMINSAEQKHSEDVDVLKRLHQKEFEKALRVREEKFQAELRYFLKEKDDQCQIKLEKATRECETKAKLGLEDVLKQVNQKHELEMHKTICEYERKAEEELQKVVEDYELRMKQQMRLDEDVVGGDEVKYKLKQEMNELREKYFRETSSLEKMKEMGEDRENEVVRLSLRRKEEESIVKEEFEKQLERMRLEHESTVTQLQQELEKLQLEHESTAKLRQELDKMRSEHESTVKLRQELDKMRSEHESTVKLKQELDKMRSEQQSTVKLKQELDKMRSEHESTVKLKQELDKMRSEHESTVKLKQELDKMRSEHESTVKLKQELDKMRLEHESTVKNLQKELDSQKTEVEFKNRLLDSLERERDTDKKIAEQMRREIGRVKASVKDAQGMTDQIQEQRVKWFQDAQDYISKEIQKGVEDGLTEEREKFKQELERSKDNLEKTVEGRVQKELEVRRDQVEKEKKEEVRRVEEEVESMKRKFVVELEARVLKEKSRLEQEVKSWKEEATRKMEEDRGRVVKLLRSDAERDLWEEKRRIESEVNRLNEKELKDMREEMELEMRKRIQKERDKWDREKADSDTTADGRYIGWPERLKSEMEARTKACLERDQAVNFLKSRELFFLEEKQKLIAGLKKCRGDLEEMKQEQMALEDKYTEMDRKYTTDMKEARRIRDQDLAKLKLKLDEEKESLAASFKVQAMCLQDEYNAAIERVRKDGEREKASLLVELPDASSSTILELRDQYLDTVAKIKADVMTHVQTANMQAATTMKAEIHKQRLQVIEIFRDRCQTSIRTALTGQVPENIITALERSINLLSEHLISTTAPASTTPRPTSAPTTPQSRNTRSKLLTREFAGTNKQNSSESRENVDTGNNIGAWSKGNTKIVRPDEVLYSGGEPARKYADPVNKPSVLDEDVELKDVQERHLSHLHQQNYQRLAQPHPQLEKVDLFDSDTFHHTPPSSNNSSPASQRHMRSQLKSPAVIHHVTLPEFEDMPENHSPRDDMKVIEARVRLANWAKSGEMPWKSSDKSSVKTLDDDGFVKPGLEAEQWLRTQRDPTLIIGAANKHGGSKTYEHNNNNHVPPSTDGSDDSASSGTNISFMTLEPEVVENSGLRYVSLGPRVAKHSFPQPGNVVSQLGNVISERKGDTSYSKRGTNGLENASRNNCNHSDHQQDFGSQSSTSSLESFHSPVHKHTDAYGKVIRPASTPLMKVAKVADEMKIRSERSINSSKQWKSIGGTIFFEPLDLNRKPAPEPEPVKYSKSELSFETLQPNSPVKKSSRSRSVEGIAEDLVQKSGEFPSDLSRITQVSSSEQPHLWKYKSLEDLITDLERPDREKGVVKDVKTAKSGRKNQADHGRTSNQKQVDFVSRPRHLHAPVKAMTSEFWECQSEEDAKESNIRDQREPGFSKFGNIVTIRTENEVGHVNQIYNKKNSPTRHKTPGRKGQQLTDYQESRDAKVRKKIGSHWHTPSESRSEPRPSGRRRHLVTQLSQEDKNSGMHRTQEVPVPHRLQRKQSVPSLSDASSVIFMSEVTDMRRSLEDLQPLQFLHHASPHKNAAGSRMTRSLSDQSLHTIHHEGGHSQGQGHRPDNHIDALVSTYVASQSHFDLRPFTHDEHF